MKINMHTSHPSAFISSTFVDLKSDRAQVARVLADRGLNVNALDIQPASSQTSKKEILTGIRESDFVILIIGDRYGSILPSMTGSSTLSITFWEYNNAIKMGKPVIAYFKSGISSDPIYHDDKSDKEYAKKRKLFERFKSVVSSRHNPAYYSSPEELADKLDKSLISIYRSGVKKLTSEKSELNSKIVELESELTRLKSQTSLGQPAKATESQPSFLSLGLGNLKEPTGNTNSLTGLASLMGKNKA
ncbi:TPA: DUF4062 domain-containing protein [Vibrio parahaemolyticus]|uniref:DUF4062 domain-containing protein n=1 Tax=Vibrio parahaemolyticus TaxID=670 RepID=UPI001E2F4361|nr:DUF4062 domain-containing protein [Vibrio parahaemolyticus]EJO9912871.1 DUF4062 domain-containing protein [Vibrio parahaemolyticus]HCE4755673.1 DUF4062 domain-containing protein [Vibrio parahaemolyticus]HCH2726854.1 DUF4062 domain-containing protein [Vibrio parahaemolyticus]HCM0804208.1 DUF4062 domain-containing protein [Vibrio parahaemolyticus]